MDLAEVRHRIDTMFSDLIFDSQRHLYFVNNTMYPSVSSLVEGHAPKFNSRFILPACARKEGISEKELADRWQRTNKLACDIGHETHDFMEHYSGVEVPKTPQQVAGVKFFTDYADKYEIITRECRGYSKIYGYAGTMDLPLWSKQTQEVVIADYKTNKDLWKSYDYLHPPFQFLEASPYCKYQLQLSYYQILLEEIGIKVSNRILVYLRSDGDYQVFDTYDYSTMLKKHLTAPKTVALW